MSRICDLDFWKAEQNELEEQIKRLKYISNQTILTHFGLNIGDKVMGYFRGSRLSSKKSYSEEYLREGIVCCDNGCYFIRSTDGVPTTYEEFWGPNRKSLGWRTKEKVLMTSISNINIDILATRKDANG